jgi:hypothetical protein
MHPLIGLAFGVAILVLWGACAAWLVNDAQMRGRSGCAVVLVLGFFAPCAVPIWLLVRPSATLAQRPADDYTNADDALAAASKLDVLGEWDAAIALYQHAATRWPEHCDYISACINTINDKVAVHDVA